MKRYLCGIDPGREKFGLALCTRETLDFSAVIPIERLDETARSIALGELASLADLTREGTPPKEAEIEAIFLGDGTSSEIYARALEAAGRSFEIVDEHGTTLEARGYYWRLHPPRYLWRLVPTSLRVPPRPIDDLAAWAIAIRGSR